MRHDAALTFLSHSIARESRVNLGTHYASARTVNAASYSVTPNDCGHLLLYTTGALDRTVTLPPASGFENGFTVVLRKADTGLGRVIVQSGATLATLYQEFDEVGFICDGSNWRYLSIPEVDRRSVIDMVAAGSTIQINPRLNGRYKRLNIPLSGFAGTATDNRTIEFLAPFLVGDEYYLWLPRTNEAGTKTLNFSASGMTIRRTWGAGAFTFPQNQRHRFIAEVVASNEIHIFQQRIQP